MVVKDHIYVDVYMYRDQHLQIYLYSHEVWKKSVVYKYIRPHRKMHVYAYPTFVDCEITCDSEWSL